MSFYMALFVVLSFHVQQIKSLDLKMRQIHTVQSAILKNLVCLLMNTYTLHHDGHVNYILFS